MISTPHYLPESTIAPSLACSLAERQTTACALSIVSLLSILPFGLLGVIRHSHGRSQLPVPWASAHPRALIFTIVSVLPTNLAFQMSYCGVFSICIYYFSIYARVSGVTSGLGPLSVWTIPSEHVLCGRFSLCRSSPIVSPKLSLLLSFPSTIRYSPRSNPPEGL